MFQLDKNNVVSQQMEQHNKESYIANMLVRTLMSNTVTYIECCHIVELLKEKIQCVKDFDDVIQDVYQD